MKALFLYLILVIFILGCNPEKDEGDYICEAGQYRCDGNMLQNCKNHQWEDYLQCGEDEAKPVCNELAAKCVACEVGAKICGPDGNVYICDETGSLGDIFEQCNDREQCVALTDSSICESPCEQAARVGSYQGCEFWAMTLCNQNFIFGLDPEFRDNFAVVVHNPQPYPVDIHINGLGENIEEILEANSVRTFLLPYNEDMANCGTDYESVKKRTTLYTRYNDNSGYRIISSEPVVVYQFNPYDYELNGVWSYTNDASLLFPTHSYGFEYFAMSRPNLVFGELAKRVIPSTVGIVAKEDNTKVTIITSAYISLDGSLSMAEPGGIIDFDLNQGDLLQLVATPTPGCSGPGSENPDTQSGACNPGYNYDFTGTHITADKPIGVWGGHSCTFIPFGTRACDHLEDMLPPVDRWGSIFYVGLTKPYREGSLETNIIRILGGDDDVEISFEPPVHDATTLQKGEYFEFIAPVETHFKISSTGPVLVGKYMVGGMYANNSSEENIGDPSFGIVVPVQQYLSDYAFVTPMSMLKNYVNVTARIPDSPSEYIMLDGAPLTPDLFEPITGEWGVARIEITDSGENGKHTISAPYEGMRFGIEVYGVGMATSYLYPGGMQFREIILE